MHTTESEVRNPFEDLEALMVERDWTFRQTAAFLGMNVSTLFSAVRRRRANKRTTHKVRQFVAQQRAAA